MISRIKGTLIEINVMTLLVDCHGVGYEVDVPMSTLYNIPSVGSEIVLWTHFNVREDHQSLYGFLTQGERSVFRKLIKVSGVGPKVALAVLSTLSIDEICQSFSQRATSRLLTVPGIGKKTAERMMIELHDKFDAQLSLATMSPLEAWRTDAYEVLIALGYSSKDVQRAFEKLPHDVQDLTEAVRYGLSHLSNV